MLRINTSHQSSPTDQPARLAFFLTIIYIALIFVRPQEFVPPLLGLPLIPVSLLCALLSWSISANKALDAPQFMLLGLLFLFSLLTVLVAGQGGSLALDILVFLAPIFVTFLLLGTTALSRKRTRIMMWMLVGGATLMGAHGIQQEFTGVGWTGEVPVLGRIRYIGVFNDPNDVGLSLIVALPMAMYLLSNNKSMLIKLFLLACIGSILYGIILTDSRGTTMALGAILGAYSWRRFGVFKTALMGMIAIPIMFHMTSRMDTISAGEASALGRVEAWYEGFYMLIDNPIFGVGFGLFTEHHFRTAHNSFVLVLAELGIPGYFLWFSFIGTCVMTMYLLQKKRVKSKSAWQTLVECRIEGNKDNLDFVADETIVLDVDPQDRAIARVLFLSFVGFATASFFLSRSYSMQLMMLCGIVVAHYQGSRLRNPDIPAYRFLDHFWYWASLAAGSVIFLYMTVTVLLGIA